MFLCAKLAGSRPDGTVTLTGASEWCDAMQHKCKDGGPTKIWVRY